MAIKLPHDVTAQRMPISPTSFEYTFSHKDFGELGRVLFSATPQGACHVTHHPCGKASDELFATRRAIFEPIAKAVAEQLQVSNQSKPLGTQP